MNFREEKDCLELTLSLCTLSRWKVEPSPACRSSYPVPSFQQLSEVLMRHQCAPAPTRVPRHRSASTGRAVTQCTPLSCCRVVFSTLLHPSHNFSDQCSVLFSGVSDGSVMAVCYLKERCVLLFVVWSDIFADQWLEDKL